MLLMPRLERPFCCVRGGEREGIEGIGSSKPVSEAQNLPVGEVWQND